MRKKIAIAWTLILATFVLSSIPTTVALPRVRVRARAPPHPPIPPWFIETGYYYAGAEALGYDGAMAKIDVTDVSPGRGNFFAAYIMAYRVEADGSADWISIGWTEDQTWGDYQTIYVEVAIDFIDDSHYDYYYIETFEDEYPISPGMQVRFILHHSYNWNRWWAELWWRTGTPPWDWWRWNEVIEYYMPFVTAQRVYQGGEVFIEEQAYDHGYPAYVPDTGFYEMRVITQQNRWEAWVPYWYYGLPPVRTEEITISPHDPPVYLAEWHEKYTTWTFYTAEDY